MKKAAMMLSRPKRACAIMAEVSCAQKPGFSKKPGFFLHPKCGFFRETGFLTEGGMVI
jgi:hypothetical protein